jgi:hypothetical protein
VWIGGGQPARATAGFKPAGVKLHMTIKGRRKLPPF